MASRGRVLAVLLIVFYGAGAFVFDTYLHQINKEVDGTFQQMLNLGTAINVVFLCLFAIMAWMAVMEVVTVVRTIRIHPGVHAISGDEAA